MKRPVFIIAIALCAASIPANAKQGFAIGAVSQMYTEEAENLVDDGFGVHISYEFPSNGSTAYALYGEYASA